MFEDISALRGRPELEHFMATIVGLRRETQTISVDEFVMTEIVDGQQRLTTLVILLKTIEKALDTSLTEQSKLKENLQELLVKQDKLSLILLQTNHDSSEYFKNYLRKGDAPDPSQAETLADKEILNAIRDCANFVDEWDDKIELLSILRNKLTFIFHEIANEEIVYTVFEVLNNRGLPVEWLDRMKSMLMAIAFRDPIGTNQETLEELHRLWGEIYKTIGLRQGLRGDTLTIGATLYSQIRPSSLRRNENAVDALVSQCKDSAERAIEITESLLTVTKSADQLMVSEPYGNAVIKNAQSRLLAVAIMLGGYSETETEELLKKWRKVTFRVYGLCKRDARTGVGDYVRLSWDITNRGLSALDLMSRLNAISEDTEHSVDWATANLTNQNCYENWQDELRYLLYRYEEYLATGRGQLFDQETWNRIWAVSTSNSIEHVCPQSLGSDDPRDTNEIFVHRLGNLTILPPGLNSTLSSRSPNDKAKDYLSCGLFGAAEVAEIIQEQGWNVNQVIEREKRMLEWVTDEWG